MTTPARALAVALALLAAAAGGSDARAQVPADLTASVAALKETTPPERLKKAALTWYLEEAAACHAAGQTARADAILRDLRAAVTSAVAAPAADPKPAPANLFPKIPAFPTNPWAQAAVKSVDALLKADARFPKGPAGEDARDAAGWKFIRITEESRTLALALGHPQSPHLADPRLVAPLLRRVSTTLEYFTPGGKRLADFGYSDNAAESYLLLRTVYPDLLLPSVRDAWEKAIAVNSDAVVAKYGKRFAAGTPGTAYPNADTRMINAMLFGSLVLNRPDLKTLADQGLALQAGSVFPDGGMPYINTQNECFTYHGINVVAVARYLQVTDSPLARKLIASTRWYYPLSIEPSGVAEYASAPSWKPYWNMTLGTEAATIVAALTDCPHNARVAALGSPGKGSLLLAPFHRPDLAPTPSSAPAPDNYLAYDQNILGPRARFGGWSFIGTARPTPSVRKDAAYDPATEFRGRSTYVGCMAMYPPGQTPKSQTNWPLSAALQDATVEVRTDPATPDLTRLSTHAFLSGADHNAATVTDRFAALSTVYRIVTVKGVETPWEVRQLWVMTPERMVGLVELRATADTTALAVNGLLKFVSGRNTWGTRKEFQPLGDNTVQYGALITRVHATDFGPLTPTYGDTFAGDAKKSGLLSLGADSLTPTSFPAGTRRFYLVEIRPQWSAPAQRLARLDAPDGLLALELQDATGTLRATLNPTAKPAPLPPTPPNSTLHRPTDRARPTWLPPMPPLPSTPSQDIPPYDHILLSTPPK